MKRYLRRIVLVATLAAAALGVQFRGDRVHGDQPVALKIDAPDFDGIDAWLNGKPKTWKDLKGQVVVVHFWTFG
jgi:cytochrome oxidase Cu insertion factor (SCO1/SenC/PrrC family)